jgi:hypothetical protein
MRLVHTYVYYRDDATVLALNYSRAGTDARAFRLLMKIRSLGLTRNQGLGLSVVNWLGLWSWLSGLLRRLPTHIRYPGLARVNS